MAAQRRGNALMDEVADADAARAIERQVLLQYL
jgi:hypothetical protein